MVGIGVVVDDDCDVWFGFLFVLEGVNLEVVYVVVEDLLLIVGIFVDGGCILSEIVERFLEQVVFVCGIGGYNKVVEMLKVYFVIEIVGNKVVQYLQVFVDVYDFDIVVLLMDFVDRLEVFFVNGIILDWLLFVIWFGWCLDYYFGFIFEIYVLVGVSEGLFVGGGCYDCLVMFLGVGIEVFVVGFFMWLDWIVVSVGDVV